MKKYLIAGAIAFTVGAIVGCGNNSVTEPVRVHLVSTIKANACTNGLNSLTVTWDTNDLWRARFFSMVNSQHDSVGVSNTAKTSGCVFSGNGNIVYAELLPVSVRSDGDMSPTLTIK